MTQFNLNDELDKWYIDINSIPEKLNTIIKKFIKKDTELIIKYVRGKMSLKKLLEERKKLAGRKLYEN